MTGTQQQLEQTPAERELFERLRRAGIEVTPSTPRSRTPRPRPLDIPGVSLSDAVVEGRYGR